MDQKPPSAAGLMKDTELIQMGISSGLFGTSPDLSLSGSFASQTMNTLNKPQLYSYV